MLSKKDYDLRLRSSANKHLYLWNDPRLNVMLELHSNIYKAWSGTRGAAPVTTEDSLSPNIVAAKDYITKSKK